ncbi:MAG: 50S ribosomal protein L25 [Dorea longicatena]
MKESVPVKIEKAIVDRLLKTCHKGSQVMLDIEGEKMNVLVKDVEFNPLKGQVDEIDFQALVSNEKVHSVAEIVLVGHEKDAQAVYWSSYWKKYSSQAYPSALVDKVEVDVSNMKVGDSIKVKDLTLSSDKDVDVMTDPETTVVTLQYVHNNVPDDDEDEAAAETAE